MTPRSRSEVLARLRSPGIKLATVSGVLTTRPAVITWVDRAIPEIALITTKSYQVRPNPGNREPVLCEDPEGPPGTFGNAVGLRNPGMEVALHELRALPPLRALLAVSLAGSTVEEFSLLARTLEPAADLFELNLSCPHATDGSGTAVGSDPASVREICAAVRRATQRPFLAKLTPNVADIGALAEAAMAGGADGIAAVNTAGPFVYREPITEAPILSHPQGLGGRSGEGIRELALVKVAAIRRAVGPRVPVVGMGGVSNGKDVRRMLAAGADVVGVGSVLARLADPCGARSHGRLLVEYFAALARDAVTGLDEAGRLVSEAPQMAYRSLRVRRLRRVGEEAAVLELEGSLACGPSQYAFLFLPGVGEKPFSIVRSDPLTFVFRRRGPFTRSLWEVRPGGLVLVRGPYGAPGPREALDRGSLPGGASRRAVVLAGGTGIAVAPSVIRSLRESGWVVSLFYGVARPAEASLARLAAGAHERRVVPDRGEPGRVIRELAVWLARQRGDLPALFCNIGPLALMRRAADVEEAACGDASRILLSLETHSLCGVGVCGLCEVGGRLLCREGTFVSLQRLRAAGGWEALAPG